MAVSRLWKRLGLTQPMFRIWSETDSEFAMDDHAIKSISINRGSANSVFGTQEHTMEVNSAVPRGVRTTQPIHCDLTTSGANRLVALIGGDAASIRNRYYGRIGRQTIDDAGGIADESKWHTNFYCSKWQSQLENSDRVGNQIGGELVMYLFDHFMNPDASGLDYLPPAEFPSLDEHYGWMSNTYDLGEAKIPYSEFSTKYFTDPGYYVQNTRAGADRVLTIQYRQSQAQARLDSQLPITRSQAISPAQWEQPNEDRPSNHYVAWRDADGDRSAVTGPDPNDVRVPRTDHDVSYIRWASDYQPTQMMYASYGAERTDTGYRIPSITVDMLRLIDSPVYAHRLQARQLLRLEMGEPIYLSNDWHPYLRGIHFAVGITEKISPDGWEIELSLMPSISVTGFWTPEVPAQMWDSARYAWDEDTRQWDSA